MSISWIPFIKELSVGSLGRHGIMIIYISVECCNATKYEFIPRCRPRICDNADKLSQSLHGCLYTVSQKKEATKLSAITFSNLNRFSKLFHC